MEEEEDYGDDGLLLVLSCLVLDAGSDHGVNDGNENENCEYDHDNEDSAVIKKKRRKRKKKRRRILVMMSVIHVMLKRMVVSIIKEPSGY